MNQCARKPKCSTAGGNFPCQVKKLIYGTPGEVNLWPYVKKFYYVSVLLKMGIVHQLLVEVSSVVF
jgi:hypothetical protein